MSIYCQMTVKIEYKFNVNNFFFEKILFYFSDGIPGWLWIGCHLLCSNGGYLHPWTEDFGPGNLYLSHHNVNLLN